MKQPISEEVFSRENSFDLAFSFQFHYNYFMKNRICSMEKPFTVRDIAEKAGVSLGTVSRVLNNAANIDPKLREQTLAVIRANHYVPLRRPRRSSRRDERFTKTRLKKLLLPLIRRQLLHKLLLIPR